MYVVRNIKNQQKAMKHNPTIKYPTRNNSKNKNCKYKDPNQGMKLILPVNI